MIKRVTGIYDDPEIYQIACAYRDIPAEAHALLSWAGKHWELDGAPQSVLELAAGPAEHAIELARQGLRATALDTIQGDMRDFVLPAPVDLALTMLNSACHLFTLDDMVAHLAAVAANVVPGGLYIMELAHPADYLTQASRTSSEWTIEKDGLTAEVRWGGPLDAIDPVTQVTREHVTISVTYTDGIKRTVTDVVPNRFWTATELTAAITLAGGLSVAATYGDFDDTTPVDAPEAWRMVLVLRRDA
jgi:hypothetical protein